MGAGQIGGIATLLEIDFKNPAGFLGTYANQYDAQFIVHYFSHALIFCVGTLIEPHVILTPAICVFGEKKKFQVFAGTHKFIKYGGVSRWVNHLCTHKDYNHSARWTKCASANIALLVLNEPFSFNRLEPGADFVINRLRYASNSISMSQEGKKSLNCHFFGWGSRRSAFLVPLFIDLRRVNVVLLHSEECAQMWNYDDDFLCVQQFPCRTKASGALCPDDVGTVIECSGYVKGMMISRLIDRPCGIGYLDLSKFNKFITCGVDDAREIVDNDNFVSINLVSTESPEKSSLINPSIIEEGENESSSQSNLIEETQFALPPKESAEETSVTEESVVHEPITEESVIEERISEQSIADKSITEESKIEEPNTEEPTPEEPFTNEATEEALKKIEEKKLGTEIETVRNTEKVSVDTIAFDQTTKPRTNEKITYLPSKHLFQLVDWKDKYGYNNKRDPNKMSLKSKYLT